MRDALAPGLRNADALCAALATATYTRAPLNRNVTGAPYRSTEKPFAKARLGRCGRISGGVFDCCDLVPTMDDFAHGTLALADRVGDDGVVPVAMPGFIGGVENPGEHTAVGQSNAHGSADKGFNLLISHASEIT
ncbi:MAG: hypothetical protein WBE30_12440 [Candidatus Cybelea sp.]